MNILIIDQQLGDDHIMEETSDLLRVSQLVRISLMREGKIVHIRIINNI